MSHFSKLSIKPEDLKIHPIFYILDIEVDYTSLDISFFVYVSLQVDAYYDDGQKSKFHY